LQKIFCCFRFNLFVFKFRLLRVRVRAPRPAVMRRREPAQIPLLPLAADLVHFPAELEVQQGAELERIGRSRNRRRTRRRRRRRTSRMMKSGRRTTRLLLHEGYLGLLRIQKRNPRREMLPSR
jgi:hypothetical protein